MKHSTLYNVMLKKLVVTFVFVLPLAVWILYKPVRILLPGLNGVTCVSNVLCLEETSTMNEASILYEEALFFVTNEVGEIRNNPRIIFCITEKCNQSFGFHSHAKAHTIGVSGIVISPQGWNEHILRHELIHHLQAERLGVIKQWRSPTWFKEGMAYSLSQDSRPALTEPLLKYKAEFDEWLYSTGKDSLWEEADKL